MRTTCISIASCLLLASNLPALADEHWSFTPLERPPLPQVADRSSIRNEIDHFVLARLEHLGMRPAQTADRRTLIRRLTLDLTGIPPSLDEIERFLSDGSPTAYPKLVDRLLASPRYGEHAALTWLDAARYADTNGYQTDGERSMWRWRDWVIDALNAGQSFDEFTIDQLAGDLLPEPTPDQILATGFHRNLRGNGEGGSISEEFLAEYAVDRVDTTATVWLGLTIACARCHDHKYDPFTQRDFYRLFAFFDKVPERGRAFKYGNSPPVIRAPTRPQRLELERIETRLRSRKAQFERLSAEHQPIYASWIAALRSSKSRTQWFPVESLEVRAALDEFSAEGIVGRSISPSTLETNALPRAGQGKAAFGFYDAFSISAWVQFRNPENRRGAIASKTVNQAQGTGYALRLEDGYIYVDLVKRWLDDAVRVRTARPIEVGPHWRHIAMTYDGSRLASGIEVYIDGKKQPIHVELDELNQSFVTEEELKIGHGAGDDSVFRGRLDEVRVFGRKLDSSDVDFLSSAIPLEVLAQSSTPAAERKLRRAFATEFAPSSLRTAYTEILAARRTRDRFVESFPTVMVMRDRPDAGPTRILQRGRYDLPGEEVLSGTPPKLGPAARDGSNRLELARWVVGPGNPLTARVLANRIWRLHFGRGLVATENDFGTRGTPPTHPALLDWLASELQQGGWDVKALRRTIVLSATYRQMSQAPESLWRQDRDNNLLARGPRVRLSAHAIRDQALAISGLLVDTIGGPSVKPYQPPGLWKELSDAEYQSDPGEGRYRRSLYTFVKRTAPPPNLALFDAPNRETCSVGNTQTNTPLQALVLLNDVHFVDAARALAVAALRRSTAEPSRLSWMFQRATSRPPSDSELKLLRDALAAQRERFRAHPKDAEKLWLFGRAPALPSEVPSHLSTVEIAAYTLIGSLLLNLDEVIHRY